MSRRALLCGVQTGSPGTNFQGNAASRAVSGKPIRSWFMSLFTSPRTAPSSFQDYELSLEQATVTGTAAGAAAPTILQPTWGEWSDWGACSRTCGGGRQSRVRECLTSNLRLNCTGDRVDVRDCNTQCCPGMC